jgi:glycine cleavage system H protein
MSTIPSDRKYTQTHEWFKAEGDIVTIGITQYAADELTDITFVDLPDQGTAIEPGVACGEIESVKATSELFSAVGGKVVEVNKDLEDQPELVNSDPFEAGWMLKIQAEDLSPLDNLMDPEAYEQMLGES